MVGQRHVLRRVLIGAGVLMMLAGLVAVPIEPGARAGIGVTWIALLGLGALTLLWGALPRGSRVATWYRRCCIAGASIYATLLACELVLSFSAERLRAPLNAMISLRGLFRARAPSGYELVPGWQGFIDDGIVRAAIRINAKGLSDDEEPVSTATERIAILGDSFAFGWLLDPTERIDRRLEEASGGSIDAQDFGVPGYGAEDSLIRFRENDGWRGDHVFFLMFQNDLRADNLDASINTAFEGLIVKRAGPDGAVRTEDELKQEFAVIAKPREPIGPRRRVGEAALLVQIRKRLAALRDRQIVLSSGPPDWYAAENRAIAVAHCVAMCEVAAARGAEFSVVYIPVAGEVAFGEYSAQSADFIARAKAAGLEVIELLEHLAADHYFRHDEHFNASGAEATAKILLQRLRR